jgi:lysozyme family protein
MAQFSLFASFVKQAEGGYQNNANDPGNYNSLGQLIGTNKGISGRLYEQLKGFVPTVQHIKNITVDEARLIFKNQFWDKIKADQIQNQAVAEIITDHFINAGYSAHQILINTLNGEFGKTFPHTQVINSSHITAINSIPPVAMGRALAAYREKFYRESSNTTFIKGWVKRVAEIANRHGLKAYITGDTGLFVKGQKAYAKFSQMPLRQYKKVNGVIHYNSTLPIIKMHKSSEYVGVVYEIQRYKDYDVVCIKRPDNTYGVITSNAIRK